MTTTSDDELICDVCKKPHPWPDGTVPKHPFEDGRTSMTSTQWMGGRRADRGTGSGPNDAQRGSRGPSWGTPRPSYPIDPVLRQALVDKGVLTPQDLRDAEDKIQAITGMFHGGGLVTRAREGASDAESST